MIQVLIKITWTIHNYVVCLKILIFFGDQGHISELKLCVDISELRFLIWEYAAAVQTQTCRTWFVIVVVDCRLGSHLPDTKTSGTKRRLPCRTSQWSWVKPYGQYIKSWEAWKNLKDIRNMVKNQITQPLSWTMLIHDFKKNHL